MHASTGSQALTMGLVDLAAGVLSGVNPGLIVVRLVAMATVRWSRVPADALLL